MRHLFCCVCFAVFPVARTLLRRLCHFNKLPKQRHKNNVCFGTKKKTGKSHVVVCCDTLADITVSDVYVCVYVYICSVYVYSGLGVYVVDFVDFWRLLSCSMLLLRFSSTIYLSIRHCGSRSSKSRGEWTQTGPLEINNRSSCCQLARCKILSWLGSPVWSRLLALSPNRRGRLKCTTVKSVRVFCRASLTGRCTPSSWRKWSSSLESQKPTWAFPERTWQWKTTWVARLCLAAAEFNPAFLEICRLGVHVKKQLSH